MCKFDDIKQQFVKYVLDKANLYSDVFSTPYYEDSRVYVESFEAQYIIKIWTITKEDIIYYTLYKSVNDHGEELDGGLYFINGDG